MADRWRFSARPYGLRARSAGPQTPRLERHWRDEKAARPSCASSPNAFASSPRPSPAHRLSRRRWRPGSWRSEAAWLPRRVAARDRAAAGAHGEQRLARLRFGEFETPRGSNPRRPWEKHKRSRLAHVIAFGAKESSATSLTRGQQRTLDSRPVRTRFCRRYRE